MAIPKKYSRLARQKVAVGESAKTETLDASNPTEVIRLAGVAEKVSFQAFGTLVGTVTFSVDGTNFADSTAIAGSNAIASFNSHNVLSIKVTRTGGSGFLAVAAK